jgi:hypothetical protein
MVERNIVRNLIQIAVGSVIALAASGVAIASISQGYTAKGVIASGSLVALDQTAGTVIAADSTNSDRLFGVVVPPNSASLSLGASSSNQAQIVTSGSTSALISTEGGAVHVGDAIAVSSIAGVGEKAPSGKHRIIGTAQANFDGSGGDSSKRTIKDSSGASHEISLGQIPVVIAVADYTTNAGGQDYQLPNWLQNFSNQVAGRSVAPIRIVTAGLILLVTLVSVTVLLYAAVRNSIISIGRNPLSRSSVLRGLMQVIGVTVILMGAAGGAIYLVITR